MSLIKIPEYILLSTVRIILNFIASDYNGVTDKTQSVLYQLIGGLQVDKYVSFDQAVAIFITAQTGPREINTNLIYNMELNSVPSIYISLPSESSGQNSIGNSEGFQPNILNQGNYQSVYTRRFQPSYQIVITSDNSNEVVIIYHVLRAFLISLTAQLEFLGLQNLQLSGNDIGQNGQLSPNSYYKGINLSFFYDTSSMSLYKYPIITDILAIGTPLPDPPIV